MHVLTYIVLSLFPDFLPRCGLSYRYLLFYAENINLLLITTPVRWHSQGGARGAIVPLDKTPSPLAPPVEIPNCFRTTLQLLFSNLEVKLM